MNAQLQRQKPQTAQTGKPNLTGIPTQMKLDFERRSGLPFDDVRVHYNSEKPAQLGALAYTRGTQIHVGPGQERHLPHELGHVIQQKLGVARPTCIINGVPIAENPSLERGADMAAGSQAASFSSSPRETSPVVQRKGAVSLAQLLEINGYPIGSVDFVSSEIKDAIQGYDKLPSLDKSDASHVEHALGMELNQLALIKILLSSAFEKFLLSTRNPQLIGIQVFRKIIESEILVVKKQLAKWSFQGTGPLTVYEDELMALNNEQRRISAIWYKYGKLAETGAPEYAENPWESHKNRIGMVTSTYEKNLREIQARKLQEAQDEKLRKSKAQRDTPTKQEDPYAVMDQGNEWISDPYLPFITGEHGKIKQLSKANMKSINKTVLEQGGESISFSKIEDYEGFHRKIAEILLKQTTLAHYSYHTDIAMLLSRDYAQASRINLATDNSGMGKEKNLKNTGFVFFFLEQNGRAPRLNGRFGTTRYTIPTQYAADRGILDRSWVMLADFQNAYTNFAREAGTAILGEKGMTFDRENSLSGTMTYHPSGATLEFEPFHNILKGGDIIPGLSKFAAQQLYALFNTSRNLRLSFKEVGLTGFGDEQLLNMVLKLFRLQVMVPYAVVPIEHTSITDSLMRPSSTPPP